MTSSAESTPTICYHIQTHAHPRQIVRLVSTLLRADPTGIVYLSHDRAGCALPASLLRNPAVQVSLDIGGRGRFHNVERWLKGARWLRDNRNVDFVVTLTGQDYPIRPLSDLHAALSASGDGLMEYFPVLGPGGNWPVREGRTRYLYSWHDLLRLTPTAKNRLRPLLLLNYLQPLLRVNVAYDSLRLGIRSSSPFHDGFTCWGGSFFTNLSWRSVEHVLAMCGNPEVMTWAQRSLLIEEAFFQSILISDGRFAFENRSGRYYDFSQGAQGSPATLTADDLEAAISSQQFFARKWDPNRSDEVLDELDRVIGLGG
jgi:hypothetical protein